ncbi:MAG: IS91 family transposase [Planctomycetes bacterium]|nr:IS91 family transposase [Planctomycetota bacterium]
MPEFVRQAAHSIMVCRTAVLGGHTQSCPDGHFHRVWYNSCKHRMCPQCAYLRVQQWLAKQKARILRCDHFHVIFTIPEELRFLWHFNVKIMNQILFTCSRDTLFELLSDEKYMGAKPGIIASLHTWTKTLLTHLHIHCLVTGAGLSSTGEWISAQKSFLLPYGVIRDVFRRNIRKAVMKALDKGELVLPDDMRPQQLRNLTNKLGRKKWNVRICEKYSHGDGVLTYLARYLRGGPVSNSRIVEIRDNKVTFNYGRKKRKLMTLPINEFIERFLQHIPQPNAILVRYYGLYCPNKKDDLKKCRKLLGQEPMEEPEQIRWQDCFTDSSDPPELCPICGKRLVISSVIRPTGMIPHSGSPPLLMAYLKEVA